MSDYQPTSRRPIADIMRRTATRAVEICVRRNVHPDVISYASILASAVAGGCFFFADRWSILLIAAPLFCYLRLWCNMLDGMVALAAKKASLRGEILNDLPDRMSDMLIFAGVAHSGLNHVASGYWAAMMALLTAYVGTFGQAVGVGRQFGGIMSKPWRMVVLHVGAWAMFIVMHIGSANDHDKLTILDYTCIVVIIGCVQTIWVRLAEIMRGLRLKPEAN